MRLLQLRTKALASGPLFELATELATAARESGATFILNDRADLARMIGVRPGSDLGQTRVRPRSDPGLTPVVGVHVGQTDLPPADARAIVGPDALVGLSTHSADELHAAMREPVDYVAVGAVFQTSIKGPTHPTVGVEFVRQAAVLGAAHGKPIVAIGGITLDTARPIIDAGASSVAIISDLLAGDPVERARQYLSVLGA